MDISTIIGWILIAPLILTIAEFIRLYLYEKSGKCTSVNTPLDTFMMVLALSGAWIVIIVLAIVGVAVLIVF